MISGSNEQLQQELEYTLLKPDCHSWWISKMQSGRGDTLEERYAIKFCFEVLREFGKRFRRKRPALFKSGQWHFHQNNTPVHNSLLVTVYLTQMGIKAVRRPPYSPDLAPCDFCLFPQMLSLWDNWGDERGCDEGHWHGPTRGLPWGLPEVVGTEQQVHWYRRRLLRRGLEFHVCTINKSAHTKKSLETYLMIPYIKRIGS